MSHDWGQIVLQQIPSWRLMEKVREDEAKVAEELAQEHERQKRLPYLSRLQELDFEIVRHRAARGESDE